MDGVLSFYCNKDDEAWWLETRSQTVDHSKVGHDDTQMGSDHKSNTTLESQRVMELLVEDQI